MLLDFLTLKENLHLFSRVTRKVLSNSKHTLLPPLRTKDETFAFQLSMPKVADLNSRNLHQKSKLPH